jgi:dihydroneopterin aldolase
MRQTYELEIKNMALYLNFGHLKEEQKLGQRIYIDVKVILNNNKFKISDELNTVYNYEHLNKAIHFVAKKKRYKLLEKLADDLAKELFKEKKISGLEIKIRKPSVPLASILDYVELKMTYAQIYKIK